MDTDDKECYNYPGKAARVRFMPEPRMIREVQTMDNVKRITDALTDLEAILLISPTNRRYATGFPSTEGTVLITRKSAHFFVDSRYIEAARNTIKGAEVELVTNKYDWYAQVNAVLTTKSGIVGTFSLNGDSAIQEQGYFTIHGTKGILRLGDANQFGGEIAFLPNDPRGAEWQVLEPVSGLRDNCRGIGPADMALCIRKGGEHMVSAEMACHVLDIIEQMMQSSETGLPAELTTECQRPQPFDSWRELLK